MINAIIPAKNWKYPSTTIPKSVNVLDKRNKSLYRCLQNMMPHDAYSITNHVLTMNIEDISHKTRKKIPTLPIS